MLGMSIIEIIGYLGSLLVASSMLFNSIIKLRWFSLMGNLMFTIYGFTIGAYPVGVVNAFIMLTNIFYLSKMYMKKENFRTLEVRPDNKYLLDFLDFHSLDIQKFFPSFNQKSGHDVSLLILRDMQVAGVFLAEAKDKQLYIKLDYVTPQYRDLKLGRYIYDEYQHQFKEKGFTEFKSGSYSKKNDKYLKKLGFKFSDNNKISIFSKPIY
jgi:hypothetical protein